VSRVWLHDAASGKHRFLPADQAEDLLLTGRWSRGRVFSESHRRNCTKARIGKSLTAECRQRLSLSLLGHEVTEQTRSKMSMSRQGIEFTYQHCRNISAGKSGAKWITEIFSDQERQFPRAEAEQLVSTGDWRWGRNQLHRSRVAAGVR
jgi:hypothetical protein